MILRLAEEGDGSWAQVTAEVNGNGPQLRCVQSGKQNDLAECVGVVIAV